MAPRPVPSSIDAASTHIPTEMDVTTSGGVWAPTSAKREKLRELKVQLSEENEKQPHAQGYDRLTLDDLATDEQRLDLYLADGLAVLTRFAEETRLADADVEVVRPVLDTWTSRAGKLPEEVTQVQWEEFLTDAAKDVELHLSNYPSDRCLKAVRDFYLPKESSPAAAAVESARDGSSLNAAEDATTVVVRSFAHQSILRLHLLLALGAAEHLKDSWKALTAVTDQDVDRAAVRGESVESQTSTVRLDRAVAVLAAHLHGNCSDRVDALWSLVDRDQDGLLDEVEMVRVCELAVEPYRRALKRTFQEALRANPVREPLALLDAGDGKAAPSPPPGWRQRRRDARERKRLTASFERTLRVHYLDEVEMPHRLRCIYAWANKSHQDNKIDSVMVDESGWTGRKRYVELQPKIALSEFREVQREHFKHLDRVGGEFINSFREELWIAQGKGRNRKKLIRNCSLFLAVLCTTDLMIGML
jgi:hypothetical protein